MLLDNPVPETIQDERLNHRVVTIDRVSAA